MAMRSWRLHHYARKEAASVAVAALVLLVATGGDSFVVNSPSMPARGTQPPQAMSAVPLGAAAQPHGFSLTTAVFKSAASLALMCVAARRCSSARTPTPTRSMLPKVRANVFVCLGAMQSDSPVEKPSVIVKAEDMTRHQTADSLTLLDLKSPSIAESSVVVASPVLTSVAPSAVPRKPRAAQFAGGTRRSHSRKQSRSSRAAAGRSARRAIGKRLCAHPQGQVAPLPFDPSTIRVQIQWGVRVSSGRQHAQVRESKTHPGLQCHDMDRGLSAKVCRVGHVLFPQAT